VKLELIEVAEWCWCSQELEINSLAENVETSNGDLNRWLLWIGNRRFEKHTILLECQAQLHVSLYIENAHVEMWTCVLNTPHRERGPKETPQLNVLQRRNDIKKVGCVVHLFLCSLIESGWQQRLHAHRIHITEFQVQHHTFIQCWLEDYLPGVIWLVWIDDQETTLRTKVL